MYTFAWTATSRMFPGIFALLVAPVLLAGALSTQESSAPPEAPTIHSNANLVLVPFHVQRGKYFAADLQPSDFVLREDGHARPFTTFEGPNTENPLPLELILLFDTTPKPPPKEDNPALSFAHWDPKSDYEFLNDWSESDTSAILHKNGMDIRLAIYHYSGGQLERLCDSSDDPREIGRAFRELLDPIPAGKGELALPAGHHVYKPTFGSTILGWMSESILATLKDASASPVPARRVLIVFTSGFDAISSNSTTSQSVAASRVVDPALALNIPIDPVLMDAYKMHDASKEAGSGGALVSTPEEFGGLLPWFARAGEMTGGQGYIPEHVDRETVAAILGSLRDTALSEYMVGFSPDASPQPKKHSLAVALVSKSSGKLIGGKRDDVKY